MKENAKNIKTCDICGKDATCLCYNCINYFCDSCYKMIHEKEYNFQHKKEVIDPFLPVELKCPLHTKNPLNLFCIEEKGKIRILIYFNYYNYRIMLFLLSF